jgi:hypothetical protein
MIAPRHAFASCLLAAAALFANSSPAYACAEFDFYYTEVTESDAPACLTVSGHQREEQSPVITVENACDEPATLSWLPAGASTPTEQTIAVDAAEDITLPPVGGEQVTLELSWQVGTDTGRLNVRAWNEPELCPDTGLDCAMHAPSKSPPAAGSFVGLLVVGLFALRRF